jgi:hypothetical protein
VGVGERASFLGRQANLVGMGNMDAEFGCMDIPD